MAEEAQDSAAEAARDIELEIEEAMRSRVSHFKEQSDSLTFEGVRRLLEKDLGLEKFALDVHKRFVKQRLLECLNGTADDNGSKDSEEMGGKHSNLKREAVESPEELESKNDKKEPCTEDEEKMEDSPVMGLLTGKGTIKLETEDTKANNKNEVTIESSIKKALWKRASYIKANSEKVTMAGLRRLLEEDLKLDKLTLDPYKKFISQQLDEALKSSEVSEPKKKFKKNAHEKASEKVSSEDNSDSSDKESDEEGEDEVKPKKKIVTKRKINSEVSKKRKRPEKETKASVKKRIKPVEAEEDNSDAEDGGNASEDSNSQSSAEKPVKKKEVSAPAYGKRVEHLKSVIKSCGMSVPPVIYKKVKQVPENKREAQLIKELEEILSREGLSSNPSEKEIKEVRKRKERAKELEGIDTSNIVSSSRRRSTSSYVPPPKPKIPLESDGEKDDSGEEDDDDDNDDDDEEDDDDDEDNDGDDGSQSEEDDGNDEDSD